MPIDILGPNTKLWLDKYNLTGDLYKIDLQESVELLDNTVFGDDTRSRIGGLKSVKLDNEGLWQGDDDAVDDALFGKIGVRNVPVSVSPDGVVSYLFRATQGLYQPGAEVGQILRFSVSAEGSGGVGLVHGQLLHNAVKTATGVGSGAQLGAVGASQSLYAALHVIAASGTTPTLDVVIQSDDASGFASPTTQLTFAQATGLTSEWLSKAGAIADDWYRVSFTIGGTTPSFEFIVSVGIL